MKPRYCYWTVCEPAQAPAMERCVQTARRAGVFKEFNVFCRQPIADCTCYEMSEISREGRVFILVYLKGGISKLSFEYFVWLEPETVFTRAPGDLASLTQGAPFHTPLEARMDGAPASLAWDGAPLPQLAGLMRDRGLVNAPYFGRAAFWVVHRDAIATVCDLALDFWHEARRRGLVLDISAGLSYAMQMLCAEPTRHLRSVHPRTWAADDEGVSQADRPSPAPWPHREPVSLAESMINPSLVHLPGHNRWRVA